MIAKTQQDLRIMKLNTTDVNPFSGRMIEENESPYKRQTQVNKDRYEMERA